MNRSGSSIVKKHLSSRTVDNTTAILGDGAANAEDDLGHDFKQRLQKTLSHEKTDKTRRDYRNRILRMTKYFQQECFRYFEVGVRKNTSAEMRDPAMYFYDKYEYDLIYAGLNVDYVLKFLMDQEKTAAGNLRTKADMQKFRDAIKWGAQIRGEALSQECWDKLDLYLFSYKRQVAAGKGNGDVQTKEADPITKELYMLICKWAAEDGNTMVEFWTKTQWNCMSRCGNIDYLGFSNFRIVLDAHAVTHDTTKKDKDGDRCFAKHIYANHEYHYLCQWTAMGNYCALYKNELGQTQKLFMWNTKDGSAAKKYQEQLKALVNKTEERRNIVSSHCRKGHFNAYGLRKGAASYASSGTTCAPSLSSIAHRGDWSMGSVFDIYWRFLPVGDHYLGQILSGKDPMKPSFKTLPPHWKMPNPMGHPLIREVMNANFGPILKTHSEADYDPTGLLLRCLACMVWHAKSFQEYIAHNPSNELVKVPFYNMRGSEIDALQQLITVEPTPDVMTTVTGVPPHIETTCQMKAIHDNLIELLAQTRSSEETQKQRDEQFKVDIVAAVDHAIEQNAVSNGNITAYGLNEIIQKRQDETHKQLTEHFEAMLERLSQLQGQPAAPIPQPGNQVPQGGGLLLQQPDQGKYFYTERFWSVPEGFEFPPKPNLPQALRCWLKGIRYGNNYVKPFRQLRPKDLPTRALQSQMRVEWQKFFKYLENNGLEMPSNTSEEVTEAQLEHTTDEMWDLLEKTVSYAFTRKTAKSHCLSTFARKVSPSEIVKNGNPSDKTYLESMQKAKPTARQYKNRVRPLAKNPKYLRRGKQKKTANATNPARLQQATIHAGAGILLEPIDHSPRVSNSTQYSIEAKAEQDRIMEEYGVGRGPTGPPAVAIGHHDDQTSPRYLQELIDRFGITKPYPPIPVPGPLGLCACAGCTTELELGRHRCARCNIVIHNSCAEDRNWYMEKNGEDMCFCSDQCKKNLPGGRYL